MAKTPPKPKSILTAIQEIEVNNILDGVRTDSGRRSMQVPKINEVVVAKRAELSDALQISRSTVIEGMQDAINMAKLAADPMAMIRGWSEIAKMLGLYAPEVKKIEMSIGARNILSKYEAMSDEELIAITEGRTIEGEVIDRTVQ
jgi:hypothetical protein